MINAHCGSYEFATPDKHSTTSLTQLLNLLESFPRNELWNYNYLSLPKIEEVLHSEMCIWHRRQVFDKKYFSQQMSSYIIKGIWFQQNDSKYVKRHAKG